MAARELKQTAELLTDAWLVHYSFFKEHEALGNVPPAQKMGGSEGASHPHLREATTYQASALWRAVHVGDS